MQPSGGWDASAPQRANPDPDSALTFGDVRDALRRRMRWLLLWGLGIAVVIAILLLQLRNYYTSAVAVIPETRTPGSSSLGGLAALAGVNLGTLGTSQSPQFYAAVLQSRPIQYAVLHRSFSAQGIKGMSGDSAQLYQILNTTDKTLMDRLRGQGDSAKQISSASAKLNKRTGVSVDLRSGIIRLTVTHWSPQLAAAIANAYAEELIRFNFATRQTQARARREFLEKREREAAGELAGAEANMRGFLERNRDYENSPSLRYSYGRLQRALTVQEDLYLDLRKQLDAARISEVDDVPALSVIERAIPAQRKSGPNRTLFLLASLILAGTVLATLAVLREYRVRLFGEPSHAKS